MVVTAGFACVRFVVTVVTTDGDQDCIPGNLLPCITAHFNVRALHVINMRRFGLLEYPRRSWMFYYWTSGLELGPSRRGGPRSGRDPRIVEDGSRMEGFSGR